MKLWKILGSSVIAGALAVGAVYAEPNAGEQPKAEKPEKKAEKAPKAPMLRISPLYKDLPGLTDEQKQKLSEIDTKARADKVVIDQKAKEESLAVLNDEQRAALKATEDKKAADRKPAGKKEQPKAEGANAAE